MADISLLNFNQMNELINNYLKIKKISMQNRYNFK